MTHIITSLCLRDSACVDVCPVECIIGGEPESEWPWYYIDPEVCIDCGACIPECPYEAIFLEDDVPDKHVIAETEGTRNDGTVPIRVPHDTKKRVEHAVGDVVDLTPDSKPNYDFFGDDGPGYD